VEVFQKGALSCAKVKHVIARKATESNLCFIIVCFFDLLKIISNIKLFLANQLTN
jgi:hypothetical protein